MTIFELFEKMRNGTADTADVTGLVNTMKNRGVKDVDGIMARIKSRDNTESDTMHATEAYNTLKSRDTDAPEGDAGADEGGKEEELNTEKNRDGEDKEEDAPADADADAKDENENDEEDPETKKNRNYGLNDYGNKPEEDDQNPGRELRKSRKKQVVTGKSKELSYNNINELFMDGVESMRKGRRIANKEGVFQKMTDLRKEAEVDGEKLSLTKAINTLASPNAADVSLSSSIVAMVVDFAFSDQAKTYGLGGFIPTTPITSNSYKGDLMHEATVRNRTQVGADNLSSQRKYPGNQQGAKVSYATTLIERTVDVDIDYSDLIIQGDPVAVVRASIARAVRGHKETLLVNAMKNASGLISKGLGTGKGLQDLDLTLWEGIVGDTPGDDSDKSVVASSGAAGVMRGIKDTTGQAIFFAYPYNENRNILGGIRYIQSDKMPNSSGTNGVKDTDTAIDALYVGDLQSVLRYVINSVTQRAGVEYDARAHSIFIYNHWADSALVTEPELLTKVQTHTA